MDATPFDNYEAALEWLCGTTDYERMRRVVQAYLFKRNEFRSVPDSEQDDSFTLHCIVGAELHERSALPQEVLEKYQEYGSLRHSKDECIAMWRELDTFMREYEQAQKTAQENRELLGMIFALILALLGISIIVFSFLPANWLAAVWRLLQR